MKITVGEMRQFVASDWSTLLGGNDDDWYSDDLDTLCPDGTPDDKTVELLNDHTVVWQGSGCAPDGRYFVPMLAMFKRWRAAQKTSMCLVEIPKDKVDDLKKLVKDLGGKLKA